MEWEEGLQTTRKEIIHVQFWYVGYEFNKLPTDSSLWRNKVIGDELPECLKVLGKVWKYWANPLYSYLTHGDFVAWSKCSQPTSEPWIFLQFFFHFWGSLNFPMWENFFYWRTRSLCIKLAVYSYLCLGPSFISQEHVFYPVPWDIYLACFAWGCTVGVWCCLHWPWGLIFFESRQFLELHQKLCSSRFVH